MRTKNVLSAVYEAIAKNIELCIREASKNRLGQQKFIIVEDETQGEAKSANAMKSWLSSLKKIQVPQKKSRRKISQPEDINFTFLCP